MTDWHAVDSEKILKELDSTQDGLGDTQIKKRLETGGLNEIKNEKKFSALKLFASQFQNFLVAILIAAVVISYIIGNVTDSALILIIIIVNGILGFVQEFRAEKAIEALKELSAPTAKVIRNGNEKQVPAKELVPGDIIIVEEGDKIPADARIIKTYDLKVDESALTGESVPVTKIDALVEGSASVPDRKNMLYMGTVATYGRCQAVVVHTGMKTEMGKIAQLIQTSEDETPLHAKVNTLGKYLGSIALIAAFFVFVVGFIKNIGIGEMFLTSAALAVSAVPEGLPALLTVTLALGVQKLSRQNSVIRKLSAIEALGSTTVIAADKTGTMTANEMTVREIYVNRNFVEVSGVGFVPEGNFTINKKEIVPEKNKELSVLLLTSLLCNDASLAKEDKWRIVGDPTEGALVVVAKKAGLDKKEVQKLYPRISEIPFSSSRKMMSTLNKSDKNRTMYSKGAPEMILARCSKILTDSREAPLSQRQKEELLSVTKEMASEGLRVLGIAYKTYDSREFNPKTAEEDMVFVGLVGMIDPPRKEVKDAIAVARDAGIRTIMITGDHKDTATAVAKKLGLYKDGERVLTGDELDKLDDKKFEEAVENTNVFSRVSPVHKSKITKTLKIKGHIVAVTGDGVNDAPALKEAHIGVAMGIKGTDVAKEASEMILVDDNFATIVKSIEEGRRIYDNIRKFIRFILTANFDEIFLITFAMLFGLPLPLLAVQILWLNLLTDALPAIALGVDPAERDIMKRKPRDPKHSIIKGMLPFIISISFLAFLASFVVFVWTCTNGLGVSCQAENAFYPKAITMTLTTSVLFELFLVFNCRSEKLSVWKTNPFSNKFLVLSVLISIILQLGIIYVPVLNSFFYTVPLGLSDWLMVIGLSITGLFVTPRVFIRQS